MKTNMNREATLKFIQKVQLKVAPKIFMKVKNDLEHIPHKYYKSFLYLMYSGYSADIIFKSYENLYGFVKRNYIDYSTAIHMVTHFSHDTNTGLNVRDLTLFELN